MKRTAKILTVSLLVTVATFCPRTHAADNPQTGFFSVTEENDAFSDYWGKHQDRHYTQGLRINVFGGDSFLTNCTLRLNSIHPSWDYTPDAADVGIIALGQNIYTPEKLLQTPPPATDRPYAGWLYTGAIYQRRGKISPNLAVMENFEADLGVVGPPSLAEGAQETIHRWWFPNDVPRGWYAELKTEPGIILKYDRLWRYSPTASTAQYMDIIPNVGADVGNVFTFATAGLKGRFGWNLPSDFGIQTIDSPSSMNGGLRHNSHWWFVYLFGGFDGRIVGRNISLDGNSFRGGPSVDKKNFVGDLDWGVAFCLFRHVEFSYVHVERTREFNGQLGNDRFGSLTLKGTFFF